MSAANVTEELMREMAKQAALGHKQFCVGVHEMDGHAPQAEWVEWTEAFADLAAALAASPTAQPDGAIAAAPQGYAVSEDVNLACLDECLDIVGHAVDETYSPKVMGLMLGALALLGSAKEEYLRPTAAARSLAGERTNA